MERIFEVDIMSQRFGSTVWMRRNTIKNETEGRATKTAQKMVQDWQNHEPSTAFKIVPHSRVWHW